MVVTQVLVSLVTAVVVYAVWKHLDGNLQAGAPISHDAPKAIPSKDQRAGHEPMNILVLGSDTRAGFR